MAIKVTTKKNIWEIVDKKELNSLIKNIKKKKMMKESLENEIKEMEDTIKNLMTECEETSLIVDMFKISYCEYERTIIDSKKLKEEHPDVYKRYSKITSSRRLTIR